MKSIRVLGFQGGLVRGALGVLGMAAGLSLYATPAHACSPPYEVCEEDSFLPLASDEAVEVPANLPGITWHVGQATGRQESRSAVLRREGGDGSEDIQTVSAKGAADTTVLFDEPLEEGTTYSLEPAELEVSSKVCSHNLTFKAGPEADLPTTLGVATAGEAKLNQYPYGGALDSCGYGADADAVEKKLTVTFDDAALPWQNVMVVVAVVDGEVWSRAELKDDTASVAVFSMCKGATVNLGLWPREHTMVFRATIPGVEGAIESDEVTFAMDCGDVDRENFEFPGGLQDPEEAGCAVHAGHNRSPASAMGMALVVAAVLLRRRTRR